MWHLVTSQLVKVREVGSGENGELLVMDWRTLMMSLCVAPQTTLEQLSHQKDSPEELKGKTPQKVAVASWWRVRTLIVMEVVVEGCILTQHDIWAQDTYFNSSRDKTSFLFQNILL